MLSNFKLENGKNNLNYSGQILRFENQKETVENGLKTGNKNTRTSIEIAIVTRNNPSRKTRDYQE